MEVHEADEDSDNLIWLLVRFEDGDEQSYELGVLLQLLIPYAEMSAEQMRSIHTSLLALELKARGKAMYKGKKTKQVDTLMSALHQEAQANAGEADAEDADGAAAPEVDGVESEGEEAGAEEAAEAEGSLEDCAASQANAMQAEFKAGQKVQLKLLKDNMVRAQALLETVQGVLHHATRLGLLRYETAVPAPAAAEPAAGAGAVAAVTQQPTAPPGHGASLRKKLDFIEERLDLRSLRGTDFIRVARTLGVVLPDAFHETENWTVGIGPIYAAVHDRAAATAAAPVGAGVAATATGAVAGAASAAMPPAAVPAATATLPTTTATASPPAATSTLAAKIFMLVPQPPLLNATDAIALAENLHAALWDATNARRCAANKLLVFKMMDPGGNYSIVVARFYLHGAMISPVLDELTNYVLAQVLGVQLTTHLLTYSLLTHSRTHVLAYSRTRLLTHF